MADIMVSVGREIGLRTAGVAHLGSMMSVGGLETGGGWDDQIHFSAGVRTHHLCWHLGAILVPICGFSLPTSL